MKKHYKSYKHCLFMVDVNGFMHCCPTKRALAEFLGISVKHVSQNLSHGYHFRYGGQNVKVHLVHLLNEER